MRSFTFFLLPLILVISCTEPETEEQVLTNYPNSHLLINANALHDALETDNIFLIDARQETGDSLITGAVHFPSVEKLTDPNHPVQSFLIGPETFEQMMREIGLNPEDRVVIYDEGNGLAAARLFYALDYYGFDNAAILNGGLQSWATNSLPITDTPANRLEGTFTVNIQDEKYCDISYVQAASEDPNKIIFDVRSEDEYTGVDKRAERSGHIPNAVHLEWSNVLADGDIPYFKSAQEIQDIYDSLGITRDKEIIPHCHTNVRGSHAYFTLRLMGYDSVRAYEGSWSEYGNAPDVAVQ
ncbi:sulfurtransferase [Rhodohalobacter halophilus]|uniref:sulfurtransferase n=1 Tax=Rhodohalobacter halophilus TaxID=1812810 RepID=UPI00083FAC5A|nr:sulfurtransferase [Rhodohalobacter halophilus]